jgi:hypothetical protein
MIKYEIKVELKKSDEIKSLIEKAYFEEGQMGKILSKNHYLSINESDEVDYSIFKGLNNVTVKISNEDVIDGVMRFLVDETEGDIRLYPISIYCIKEEDKYIFY